MNRIETPFGFSSTASEVARGIDLSGKRAIVTGGAAGLGAETARVLAAAGFHHGLVTVFTAAAAMAVIAAIASLLRGRTA